MSNQNGNPITTTLKKVDDSEVKKFFTEGVQLQKLTKKMTDLIKRDFFHRDKKTNTTKLTKELDRILANKDPRSQKKIANVKAFVRKQLQTLIKSKQTQQVLLGDLVTVRKVTMKKVTQPMIDDVNNERFIGKFEQNDLGKFRVVEEKKEEKNNDLDLWEDLLKLIDKHSVDTSVIRNTCDDLDQGIFSYEQKESKHRKVA
ncbi:MAG: hypothetical protein Unbinned3325contig1000_5 [Prokaryotic dsDNA virus sp.]|nr:MAG: hypothetical protein Unbinned3325contig1000_5 [Prokaryotic dsDNA virus sp.]|tara:strand:- start:6284 stop:6886 length:603 start_codon:yes stop_codon:yes gene_type:complete